MTSHIELFRAGEAAINSGDIERLISLCTADARLHPRRAPITGEFHGPDGFRAFWRDTEETFDKFEAHYDNVEELDDGRVFATGTFVTRGRGSAAETEVRSAVVVTFRAGEISSMHDYGDDLAAAHAAIGR
jgi:ketosteroid isomerase-like protein